MSNAGAKFSEVREQLMKDEEFKAGYEKLKSRYDLLSQIIEARAAQNITQANSPCVMDHKNPVSAD